MRLRLDIDGDGREIDVTQTARTSTLADLLQATTGLAPLPDEVFWVDQVQHQAADRLDDCRLLEASTIGRATAVEVAEPLSGWTATLSDGLDAGLVISLPTDRPLTIGRSSQADIQLTTTSASWLHCTVEREGEAIRVRDCGSTNGTYVNGEAIDQTGVQVTEDAVVVVGGAAVLLRADLGETLAPRAGSLNNVTAVGTAPFNRPPRLAGARPPDPVTPPTRKTITTNAKFNLIGTVAPLVMAVLMVVVMGNIRFMLFAALSPVMGVATWWDQKRRGAKERAEEDQRFAEALTTLREDIARASAQERRRWRDQAPDPATSLRIAALPTTRLWQRRHGQVETSDFLTLHAGVGDVPWEPPLDRSASSRLEDEVRDIVDATKIPAAPIKVELADAGVIGIVGQRPTALAVARSLVLQAAIQAGPADLGIVICCDQGRAEDWDWSVWLPHTRRHGDSSGDRWLSDDRSRSESMLRGLRDAIDGQPTPAVLLVLDSDVLTEGREAPARTLLGHGRPSPLNRGQAALVQVPGIVVAASEEQLPAQCTTIIRVGDDASATVVHPGDGITLDHVILAGISCETARQGAMELAHFDDPELIVAGSGLPSLVRLSPLIKPEEITAEVIADLWNRSRGTAGPIGVGESGAFWLDLVRDGPHGLVGGTTGSGKSEFLRSLVAGLAACNSPEKLTFILMDFKGGAAFKTCERLPHTIGTVTNLDAQMADRALRALEAEMEYRQRVFAAAGEDVDNLNAYLATNPAEPMPRLLLVIDEFAMMAKDYPEVLSSLVAVGAVGRTLGVHMILATQRPAGVVNDDILANTNLRVALRVQSREDSSNVIGRPDAAAISRIQMGRAYVKLGQDDITPVQTALVTGLVETDEVVPIELRPVVFGPPPPQAKTKKKASAVKETDLDRLIDAIVEANADAGYQRPRPVWPEPLGARVDLAGFTASPSSVPPPSLTPSLSSTASPSSAPSPSSTDSPSWTLSSPSAPSPALAPSPSSPLSPSSTASLSDVTTPDVIAQGLAASTDSNAEALPVVGGFDRRQVTFALSDDPDGQRQIPATWDLSRGNILLVGVPTSGTSTTLATLALTTTLALAPDDLDLLVLDMGAGDLAPLADLPHTAAYVGSGSAAREQQMRLLKYIGTEIDRRKSLSGTQRPTLVLVDGFAALKDEYQDVDGLDAIDRFYRSYADGPNVNVWFAVSTSRSKAIPSAMDEITTQKWLFRLADRYDYASAGISPTQTPPPVPGRCVPIETKLQTHVATPNMPLASAVDRVSERWGRPEAKTSVVRRLPESLTVKELAAVATTAGEPWRVPIGLREADLEPAFLELYENEHAIVAGPARSGKSTVLLALAQTFKQSQAAGGQPVTVWGIGSRRSPLSGSRWLDQVIVGEDDLVPLMTSARVHDGPLVILIDDAERIEDAGGSLDSLMSAGLPQVHLFAAARNDELRSLYSHWTKTVRKARCGLLLQPNKDYDGDLLGATIPRKTPVEITVGRGYACVAGAPAALVQCSRPDDALGS
ncbi:MAG: FHA domain-containing protein [Propionibacteriaceae bacterium]|nr:FHA domain-containing protein [Propionibacteriaceae bacterium]